MAPRTVDEYIASCPQDLQPVLEELRQTIKKAAPQAQEKISYGMPGFFQNGYLIYFAAWKRHIGVYGASGALEAFKEEVSPYVGEKGSLRFPLSKPIPLSLISEIVKFGVEENLAKARRTGQ
jgi:uncharacterized protein YdhG (YjbR/CyaY superfamily)